ncbi:ATP-binding protein [Armatimonas sp.]|uniref:ATP-binding protein n=1 Tax=Armatimonas sp. TaxID=1872638 RepID=UPI00374D189A
MYWRIELFGGPCLISPSGETLSYFSTQKTAALLAYLALTLPRSHPRELLAELFWPDKDPTLSRNSLSAAVSALRPLLGEALLTNKLQVGLNPERVTCDVAEFEARLAAGDLDGAASLAQAEFLPSCYDDWVVAERERLATLYGSCVQDAARSRVGQAGKLHDLPRIESGFVGREQERDELLQLLCGGVRLLTLKGMGGVGKTRLAHNVAPACRAHFSGGVFWVGLEDVQSGDAMLRTLASVLHVPIQRGEEMGEQVGRALEAHGKTLLVLDNTEQIPDAAAVIRSLLARAPECTCLVTSRRVLRLRAERVLELSPLPLTDAEQLFCERATAGSGLLVESTADVRELCLRLDGLPLALELAAARMGTLTPSQMLARFEERFRLLQSRTLDLPERQRTLRATIDWSYDVLSEGEQRLLAQLSVFVGSFTLDDAEAVFVGEDLLEGVQLLHESSLLSTERHHLTPVTRFVLLESLRHYAAERLAAQPPLQQAARTQHARYFLQHAEHLLAQLRTRSEAEALYQLDSLAPNLRAALEAGPPELAPRLALALARPLQRRGFFQEAIPFLERGLVAARLPELLWERAGLHFDLGELANAQALAQEAQALYLQHGEQPGVGRSLNLLGQIAYKEKCWSAARQHLEHALAAAQEPLERAIVQNNLALVELEAPAGSPEKAVSLLTEALVVRRAHGDLRGVAAAVANLGNLAFARSDWEAAQAHFQESLEVESALGHVFGVARALNNLGETVQQQGKPECALRLYIAAHQLFCELRHEYATYTETLMGALLRESPFLEAGVAELRQELFGKSAEEIVQEARKLRS